jgi:hypothetical protein
MTENIKQINYMQSSLLLDFMMSIERAQLNGNQISQACGLGPFRLTFSFGDIPAEKTKEFIMKLNKRLTKQANLLNIVSRITKLDVLYLEVDGRNTKCYFLENGKVKVEHLSYSLASLYYLLPKALFASISGSVVVGRKRVVSCTETEVKVYKVKPFSWGASRKYWDVTYGKPIPQDLLS